MKDRWSRNLSTNCVKNFPFKCFHKVVSSRMRNQLNFMRSDWEAMMKNVKNQSTYVYNGISSLSRVTATKRSQQIDSPAKEILFHFHNKWRQVNNLLFIKIELNLFLSFLAFTFNFFILSVIFSSRVASLLDFLNVIAFRILLKIIFIRSKTFQVLFLFLCQTIFFWTASHSTAEH